MMEQLLAYYPFIAAVCIAAIIAFKFHLSQSLKHSEQFSLVYYPLQVVKSRRQTLIKKQYLLSATIALLLVSIVFLHFKNTTSNNVSSSQNTETPFAEKVSFRYKRKLYRVDVNVITENEEPVYKLYFRNTSDATGNNTMHLSRKENTDGTIKWECREESPDGTNSDIASLAGAAIEKILQNKK
jgi:hypothetical protein